MRSSLTSSKASISEFHHKKRAQLPTPKRYLILWLQLPNNLRSSMKSSNLSSKWALRLKAMTIKLRSSLKNSKALNYLSTTHSSRSALNFLIFKPASQSILSVLNIRPSRLKRKKLNRVRLTPKKIKVTNTLSQCSHSTTTLILSSKVTGRLRKILNIQSCIHSEGIYETNLLRKWLRLKSLFQSVLCGRECLMDSLPFSTKILIWHTTHSSE